MKTGTGYWEGNFHADTGRQYTALDGSTAARSRFSPWSLRENRMQSIVGTWKLLHATARDPAGAARPLPYGGKALGRLTFTADGRMMSVVCDGRKELPAGVSREYSSYCGNYTYDGERLVTRVDAASDPIRIGSDQVGVRFAGERMVLDPARRRDRRSRGTPGDHLEAYRGGSRSDQEPEVANPPSSSGKSANFRFPSGPFCCARVSKNRRGV